ANLLNLLTQQHNALLASTINTLSSSYSDADIRLLDFNQEFNTILSNPSLFGFTNVTKGCLSVSCSNPNEYFFWDESHPTTRGHSLMSDLAARTLGVPEPSSVFGLLMVGIGGLFLKKRT
ncbi:MAG: SGNH/GDSL hydrolase family protein, partial [Microcystaceae cyanobacterium]